MSTESAEEIRRERKARKVRWSVLFGGPLVGALARTWRMEEVNAGPWQGLVREGRPVIICAWHGELLPGLWAIRRHDMSAMVSEHSDGEIIARVMHRWGFRTIRGSTSRGAGRALLGMVRELNEGRNFAITPDGPRGPAGVIQQGVLLASVRARAPIVTMRCEAHRGWRLSSWDRFLVPKPFARVRVTFGDPWIAPAVDEDTARSLEVRLGPAFARDQAAG